MVDLFLDKRNGKVKSLCMQQVRCIVAVNYETFHVVVSTRHMNFTYEQINGKKIKMKPPKYFKLLKHSQHLKKINALICSSLKKSKHTQKFNLLKNEDTLRKHFSFQFHHSLAVVIVYISRVLTSTIDFSVFSSLNIFPIMF